MKTSIIDKSLCNTDFSKSVTEDVLREYVSSLFLCGVNYIEIDSYCMPFLCSTDTSQRFIFRIDRPEDMIQLEAKQFAYVVLPAELAFLAPQISSKIILEIDTCKRSFAEILDGFDGNAFVRYISMLRLSGNYPDNENELSSFISWYRRHFILPLDICPSDTEMCGLQNAFAAYRGKADALTLAFGESTNSTSLEKFLVYSYTFFGILVCPTYIEGICTAALQLSYISNSSEHGMKNLSEILNQQTSNAINIDTSRITRRKTQNGQKKNDSSLNTIIDKELEASLREILDSNSLKIARNVNQKTKYLH